MFLWLGNLVGFAHEIDSVVVEVVVKERNRGAVVNVTKLLAIMLTKSFIPRCAPIVESDSSSMDWFDNLSPTSEVLGTLKVAMFVVVPKA